MKIKIHSSELNRMMKTLSKCIDPKDANRGNVEIIYDNNLLSIRGTNGTLSAVMCAPLLGGTGESFCVDGTMFARVCAMCSGDVEISTDGNVCTIKGAGRTRLPIVKASIPAFQRVNGQEAKVQAEAFSRGYNSVSYAISADQNRVVLTGVLMESSGDGIRMTALDGFKMAVEYVDGVTDGMKTVIPGMFMSLVSQSTSSGETITFRTDGKRVQAETDGMLMACTLLAGDYPDTDRIMPKDFKTETLVKADQLQYALKSGSAVNTMNNLVKLVIGENTVTVMSNSEQADFDAEVGCETQGDGLKIAFNHKFLMETISSIVGNDIVLKFNTSVSPCIVQAKGGNGNRLILPVRVAG